MMPHDDDKWLNDVFHQAEESRWCTRPYCTTCGCHKFRSAYWCIAAQRAGIATPSIALYPRELLNGLLVHEVDAVVRSLISGVRGLRLEWCNSQSFQTVLIDLDSTPNRISGAISLLDELSGTPAFAALRRIHAHARERSDARRRRETFESPEAVEERRRIEQQRRASQHADRQAETAARNVDRMKLLEQLAGLPTMQRLVKFATDVKLNLDCIPDELIPTQSSDVMGVDPVLSKALLDRIGNRRAAWGRLRRVIEQQFGTGRSGRR
jgi:hypothetical protein